MKTGRRAAVLTPLFAGLLLALPLPRQGIAAGLPADLQAAITDGINGAHVSGDVVSIPQNLLALLGKHPDLAAPVAILLADHLRTEVPADGDSQCQCASQVASVLVPGSPEEALNIRKALTSRFPDCVLPVTDAVEESLATSSGGSRSGPRPLAAPLFSDRGGGGGGGGGGNKGCGAPCNSVEPSDEEMVSRSTL